jgi:hypothetical protein
VTADDEARRAAITDEIQTAKTQAKAEAVQQRRRGAYFWAVVFVYMVVSPALAILVSRQISLDIAHRSEQKLCGVISQADDAWKAAPPTTQSGRAQAENMAKLRRDYHCP